MNWSSDSSQARTVSGFTSWREDYPTSFDWLEQAPSAVEIKAETGPEEYDTQELSSRQPKY